MSSDDETGILLGHEDIATAIGLGICEALPDWLGYVLVITDLRSGEATVASDLDDPSVANALRTAALVVAADGPSRPVGDA